MTYTKVGFTITNWKTRLQIFLTGRIIVWTKEGASSPNYDWNKFVGFSSCWGWQIKNHRERLEKEKRLNELTGRINC